MIRRETSITILGLKSAHQEEDAQEMLIANRMRAAVYGFNRVCSKGSAFYLFTVDNLATTSNLTVNLLINISARPMRVWLLFLWGTSLRESVRQTISREDVCSNKAASMLRHRAMITASANVEMSADKLLSLIMEGHKTKLCVLIKPVVVHPTFFVQ